MSQPRPRVRPITTATQLTASAVPDVPLYGLDIETETAVDGLDPTVAEVRAVAVAGTEETVLVDDDERTLLRAVDELLANLPAGMLVTWNGARFDLPFLAARAALHRIELGLVVRDRGDGSVVARWHHHDHLDAYRVYRNDLRRLVPVSCGLKSVARLVGLPVVEEERATLHELPTDRLIGYVASDARITRELALRRWRTAAPSADAGLYVVA